MHSMFSTLSMFSYKGRTAPQVQMTRIPSGILRPIQRSQSHDFVRYTLKTTDIPLDVTYNVGVGGYIPLSHNTLKGEPLDNE